MSRTVAHGWALLRDGHDWRTWTVSERLHPSEIGDEPEYPCLAIATMCAYTGVNLEPHYVYVPEALELVLASSANGSVEWLEAEIEVRRHRGDLL